MGIDFDQDPATGFARTASLVHHGVDSAVEFGGGDLIGAQVRQSIPGGAGPIFLAVGLRTIGATRIHRTQHALPARTSAVVRVGPGALLEYVSAELIPHADAWLEQQTTVHLDPRGHAILGEVIAPGRLHNDEAFLLQAVAAHCRLRFL